MHLRAKPLIFISLLMVFSMLTFSRNSLWQSPETIWLDATEKSFSKARPFSNVGNYYDLNGEHEKALKYYNLSIKKDPDYGYPYAPMAVIYGKKGDLKKAKSILLSVIKMMPYDDKAFTSLGVVYMLEGDFLTSRKYLLQSLKLNPRDELTKKHLLNVEKQIYLNKRNVI